MRARFGSTAPNAALQPALLARHPVGLDAVADAELADRLGQVVAHRAVREVELGGNVAGRPALARQPQHLRSEEHTSELQSLMRISYAVFCLKKKTPQPHRTN